MKRTKPLLVSLLLASLTGWLSGCATQNLFRPASVSAQIDSAFLGQENTQYMIRKDDKISISVLESR